jgi:hypothetical protein
MTVIGLEMRPSAQRPALTKPRLINVFLASQLPANRPDRKFRLDPTRWLAYAESWQPFT